MGYLGSEECFPDGRKVSVFVSGVLSKMNVSGISLWEMIIYLHKSMQVRCKAHKAETNVGCSAARSCKDGSEEEERSEGSGEITGLLS